MVAVSSKYFQRQGVFFFGSGSPAHVFKINEHTAGSLLGFSRALLGRKSVVLFHIRDSSTEGFRERAATTDADSNDIETGRNRAAGVSECVNVCVLLYMKSQTKLCLARQHQGQWEWVTE